MRSSWQTGSYIYMSRLDRFILRMQAQRDLLNYIADGCLLRPDGAILELGLGNGRTYDHLREKFPERRVVVFDWEVRSHPDSRPLQEDLVLGEISETINQFAGMDVAFVHADIGTFYSDLDAQTLTWLPHSIVAALARGGIAASGLPLDHPMLKTLPLPPGVIEDYCYFYQKL